MKTNKLTTEQINELVEKINPKTKRILTEEFSFWSDKNYNDIHFYIQSETGEILVYWKDVLFNVIKEQEYADLT